METQLSFSVVAVFGLLPCSSDRSEPHIFLDPSRLFEFDSHIGHSHPLILREETGK